MSLRPLPNRILCDENVDCIDTDKDFIFPRPYRRSCPSGAHRGTGEAAGPVRAVQKNNSAAWPELHRPSGPRVSGSA